jgi:peptidoglycan/xylan/chitin deacetylase (PgdA/CDA1 family)
MRAARPLAAALLALAMGACGGGGDEPARSPMPVSPPLPPPAATRPATPVPARPRPRPRIAPLSPAPARYLRSARHDEPVPILMYHVITASPAATRYPQLWVPAQRFAQQMRALARAGYHGVTLAQVWDHWQRGLVLPRKPVVVSFDDGYFSQWKHAAPVLRALGWPGVLNLEVNNLGLAGGLSRRQLRELIGAGWEVDSHTISHPDLTTLGAAALRREVAGSRAQLRRRLGVAVAFFCYPSGRYDATVEAAVRAAGYLAATTTRPGVASPAGDPYALPRIRVNGTDTASALVARVSQ